MLLKYTHPIYTLIICTDKEIENLCTRLKFDSLKSDYYEIIIKVTDLMNFLFGQLLKQIHTFKKIDWLTDCLIKDHYRPLYTITSNTFDRGWAIRNNTFESVESEALGKYLYILLYVVGTWRILANKNARFSTEWILYFKFTVM